MTTAITRPNKSTMFGRGSPRLTLIQAAAAQRKQSPKISRGKKKKASPKAILDRSRASWNPGLEKALVDLLHDHNNDYYRGQNGWSPEAWNRVVKLFQEKFPYVRFTKVQIQDKEKELKREYRVLKEARKQSGASWDDKLCRIIGEEAVWENIITSYPKAKKFRNKSFPLFEALGELYDGHTAEGTLNFTSIAPSQAPVTQPSQVPVTQPSQVPVTQPSQFHITQLSQVPITQPSQIPTIQPSQVHITQPSQIPVIEPSQVPIIQPSKVAVTQHFMDEESENSIHNVETDDEDLRILEQPVASATAARARMGKRATSTRNKDTSTSSKSQKAAQRRRQDREVVEIMGRLLEIKEKQADAELAQQEHARSNPNEEFSIQVCVSVVDSMEELSDDEKVEAYDVFKDAQNRSIFMTTKASTRLKWLRKKIRIT